VPKTQEATSPPRHAFPPTPSTKCNSPFKESKESYYILVNYYSNKS
jgi:hypothetical protein